MAQRVTYWGSTVLLAALSTFAAFTYLTAAPEAVAGFAHVGYPQHLRVLLGIAKLSGAIALVIPGFPKLKEWAYAGFTFTWIAAALAHYLAKDGATSAFPLVLLILLGISYVTRPQSRRWLAIAKA
jgi:uncharacterized membrane protein YphA (DoxX/SURF4 family)